MVGYPATPLAPPTVLRKGRQNRPAPLVVAHPRGRSDRPVRDASHRRRGSPLGIAVPGLSRTSGFLVGRDSGIAGSQSADGRRVGFLLALHYQRAIQYRDRRGAALSGSVAAPDGTHSWEMGLGGERVPLRLLSLAPALGLPWCGHRRGIPVCLP